MMLRQPYCRIVFVGLALCVTGPAAACLWDYDTIRDERRGLPGIGEVLAGRFERHSKFFYEQRIIRMKALLKTQPNNLDAWDNLAGAYEKLGDRDKAIETILEKDKIAPGQYTTYANLGTFYLHKGDLEHGIAAIRKALEINPDAHFGPEEYQLKLALYYRDAKKNPQLLIEMSFLEHAGLIHPIPTTAPADYTAATTREFQDGEILRRTYEGSQWAFDKLGLKPNIFDGIVGMIRFGPGNSAELYLALGDLLALRGNELLAYRAYQRALDLKHPRTDYIREMMKGVAGRVYYKDQISAETIAKERTEADAWVKSYQDFEDDLVRRGVDTDDPKNYEPFYAQHPALLAATFSENVSDWYRHNTIAIVLSAVLVALVAAILLIRRYRRRRARLS